MKGMSQLLIAGAVAMIGLFGSNVDAATSVSTGPATYQDGVLSVPFVLTVEPGQNIRILSFNTRYDVTRLHYVGFSYQVANSNTVVQIFNPFSGDPNYHLGFSVYLPLGTAVGLQSGDTVVLRFETTPDQLLMGPVELFDMYGTVYYTEGRSLSLPSSNLPSPTLSFYPTILQFSASPRAVNPGQASTLTWQSISTNRCLLTQSGVAGAIDNLPSSGSYQVYPQITTQYNLLCPGTVDVATANVTVTAPIPLPPTPPVFTRSYKGATSGNQNRQWSWVPGTGGGAVEDYLIEASWLPAGGLVTQSTTYIYRDAVNYYSLSRAPDPNNYPPLGGWLPEGTYTLNVRARNGGGVSIPVPDTLVVRYTKDNNEMGVAGAVASFPSGEEVLDAIGLQYRFRIEQNEGTDANTKTKIIFASTGFYGGGDPSNVVYNLELDLYSNQLLYGDGICGANWPSAVASDHAGTSSVRVALSDYPRTALRGAKSFSPIQFPIMTALIDGIQGLTKMHMMSQMDVYKKDNLIRITRGSLVTDKRAWRCEGDLPPGDFRQWNIEVQIGNDPPYTMAIALPANVAEYISPGLLNPRAEFFIFPGYFKSYFWDLRILRNGQQAWQSKTIMWKVTEFNGYPADYGIKKTLYNGQWALEVSNDAPGQFFALGDCV